MRIVIMELRKSDRAYFKAASAVSELSEFKQHKIGVVAVYKHKIVSSGCNSYVTNPLQKKYNKLLDKLKLKEKIGKKKSKSINKNKILNMVKVLNNIENDYFKIYS